MRRLTQCFGQVSCPAASAPHAARNPVLKPKGGSHNRLTFRHNSLVSSHSQHSHALLNHCGEPVGLPPIAKRVQHPSRNTSPAFLFLLSFLIVGGIVTPCSASVLHEASLQLGVARTYARAVSNAVLEVFQVYPPVLTVTPGGILEITDGSSNASIDVIPSRQPTCQETLVVHSFGLSYGMPYVGPYSPPSCSFNRVTWNLTVTSAGRQFDRLGSVSFGDVELFRTSTAEPTRNGIAWTYLKDMTNFLSLFKTEQTIIFDLGNLINDIYTGPFNVTITAAFFTADDSILPADLILPVSKHQGATGQPSYFSVPSETASNSLTLPRNIKKAIFTVSATGQAQEEVRAFNIIASRAFPLTKPVLVVECTAI